jgi:hypothetical protein
MAPWTARLPRIETPFHAGGANEILKLDLLARSKPPGRMKFEGTNFGDLDLPTSGGNFVRADNLFDVGILCVSRPPDSTRPV